MKKVRLWKLVKQPIKPVVRFFLRLMRVFVGLEGINKIFLISGKYTPFILKSFGAQIGPGERIESPLIIHNAQANYGNLQIGNDCYIGKDVFLDLRNPIIIQDRATISMRVTIVTHMDVGSSPLKESIYPSADQAVVLEQGAYIGAGSIILHGVTIGECAMVGAGAVVVEDIPPYTVVGGVPAKFIKRIGPKIEIISQVNK